MVSTRRQDAERFLADVPEQFVFWVHDNGILKNVRELGDALNTMNDETFAYHSNDFKKDFANWVRDIIGDVRLARDLDKARSQAEAARLVAKRVSALSKLTA